MGSQDCAILVTQVMVLTSEIRVPISNESTDGLTAKLTFLGFEIDTMEMSVRISIAKLNVCRFSKEFSRKRKGHIARITILSRYIDFFLQGN